MKDAATSLGGSWPGVFTNVFEGHDAPCRFGVSCRRHPCHARRRDTCTTGIAPYNCPWVIRGAREVVEQIDYLESIILLDSTWRLWYGSHGYLTMGICRGQGFGEREASVLAEAMADKEGLMALAARTRCVSSEGFRTWRREVAG